METSNTQRQVMESSLSTHEDTVDLRLPSRRNVNLSEFRESDEDDKLGQNAVPVHGFCVPGRLEELRNTCLPMAKVARLKLLANYRIADCIRLSTSSP